VFNVSLLLFDVKQCDCCGQTIPFHDDPQLDRLARDKSHNFRRKHLHTQYHEAWFCDCDAICRGGQFYGVKKQKELDWFKAHHGFYPAEHFANDDSRKKLICVTCYNDYNDFDKTVSSALIVFCVSHPCHLTSCFIETDPDPLSPVHSLSEMGMDISHHPCSTTQTLNYTVS
jgi:hypothetical protein